MGRRIVINYPPVSSPWHLPVGTSSLTAVLRAGGHEVAQRYGHIIGLEYVLRACDAVGTDIALSVIRNRESTVTYLDEASQTLERISRAVPTEDLFLVARNNVHYRAANYNGSIESLLACIRDPEKNLWQDYFAKVEIPIVGQYKPDVYGISINDERQFVPGLILAAMVKAASPQTLIVLGGNVWSRLQHAFAIPKFAELFDFFDCLVYSEGFEPLRCLAETLEVSTTPGVVWRNGTRVVVNERATVPTSFETLPTSHFDGGARQWSPDTVIPCYCTANCPQRCAFCAISAGSDSFLARPRLMSPQKIANDIEALSPISRRFDFFDETFSVDRQLRLGRELKKRSVQATWQCYLTITNDLLKPERCRALYSTGCRAVQLGLETLSRTSLVQENKGWNHPDAYAEILRNLFRAGIQVHVFIIVGIPGERSTDTLRWLPFIEDYGEAVLTWKPSRYRLARRSPEEQGGESSDLIELLPDKPLLLNRAFRYKPVLRQQTHATRSAGGRHSLQKDVEACLMLIEEACRRHWAYAATSIIPWWTNRGRYTLEQIGVMAEQLPQEPADPRLPWAIRRVETILEMELGMKIAFASFEEVLNFFRSN